MATTTINVSVDVPGTYRIDLLTKQLTEYAKRLVKSARPVKKTKQKYQHESLCGIFSSDTNDKQHIEEYLQEKYNV